MQRQVSAIFLIFLAFDGQKSLHFHQDHFQEYSVPLPNDRLTARDARVLSQSYGEENQGEEMGLLCCLAGTSERELVPWPPSIEVACWSGLVATLLLIVAMAAPYWLVSWQDTQSPFLRMGPWEACFYR